MKYSLNLSSRSFINRRALYAAYGLIGGLLLVVLVINLMTMLNLRRQSADTRDKVAALQSRVASHDADIANYSAQGWEELRRSIDSANDVLRRDSFRWTQLLDRLETLVSSRVRVTSISPDYKEGIIGISCEARDLAALKGFLDKLNASGFYRRVVLTQQSLDTKTGNLRFDLELQGGF